MKGRLYIVLALIFAACSGLAAYGYLEALDRRVTVVVAAKDLPRGSILDESCLNLKPLPPSSLHPQTFRSLEEAIGGYVSVSLFRGEPVIAPKVVLTGPRTAVGALPAQQRAFLVPTPLSRAIGGLIESGDSVDVIFVSDPFEPDYAFAKVILQGIQVLDTRNERGGPMKPGEQVPLLGVVLSVTPQEAEILAYAISQGEVFLSGRGHLAQDVFTLGTTLDVLLGNRGDQ